MENTSNNASISSINELDFALLLEDRTFVDYFNVFNSLPIFGQHVLYNFIEKEFDYEPPIRKRRRYTDRREVVKWLIRERYRLFEGTALYAEFRLNTKLRDVDFNPESYKLCDTKGEENMDKYIFGRNILGSCIGMQMFREFLRGTPGEKIYKCWIDIENWRQLPDYDERKMQLKHAIKRNYISDGGPGDLLSKGKYIIYQRKLNFKLVPEKELFDEVIKLTSDGGKPYNIDSDLAFEQLQRLLLTALRRYWVPRYLVHVLKITSKETMVLLKRESPGDFGMLTLAKRRRHRMTIKTIYSTATSCDSSRAATPHARSRPVTPRPESTAITESEISIPLSTEEDGRESRVRFPTQLEEDKEKDNVQESDNADDGNEAEDEDSDDECDIKPDDLLALWGGQKFDICNKDPSKKEPSEVGDIGSDSADTHGLKELESRQKSEESDGPLRESTKSFYIPMSVTSYVSGRRRMATGSFPKVGNRMLCALASDHLSGAPFRTFLQKQGLDLDVRYLSFWSDVRYYLDIEDGNIDCFGMPLKQSLAKTITERYLSTCPSSETEIFSEGLKMTLFSSLTHRDDVTLLCSAQDIVTGALKGPWGDYMKEERNAFRKCVCGKKKCNRHIVEVPSSYTGPVCKDGNDPFFFFNSANLSPVDSQSRADSGTTRGSSAESRPLSSLSNMDHVCLSKEQVWKAFEITVLCNEYGKSGMLPQKEPRVRDLVDVLYSDYGSLNIRQETVLRQEFLRSLIFPPKIDIENIRVSRKVLVDDSKVSRDIEEPPRYNRLVLRRNGILIERPFRPRTFLEVLHNPTHYDFFKRFMVSCKMPYPLQFWSAVEELKEAQSTRARHSMVLQILKRFFGRAAKHGQLLDCSDDIIRQIPAMEKVPASVIVCAQASVFRSMERKWYPRYLETYPSDAEYRGSRNDSYPPIGVRPFETDIERSGKPKRVRKKKTMKLWRGFIEAILQFLKSMKDPTEVRLYEIYLRNETERDQEGPVTSFEKSMMTSSTMDMETRVVMRNRLVDLNKRANDLLFWIEVDKYRNQVENMKALVNISKSDSDLLTVKARAIIDCFLNCEPPQRVQINIPNELGLSIAKSLNSSGPVRGLFHDATILLCPILYYFWKRFHDSWLSSASAEDVLPQIEAQMKSKRPLTPHKDEKVPPLFNIRYSTVDVTHQNYFIPDEDRFKISFSMQNGMKLIYPVPRVHRTTQEKQSLSQISKVKGKQNKMSVSNFKDGKKNHNESKNKLRKNSLSDVNDTSTATNKKESIIPVKVLTPQQERARKLSMLVEELNQQNTGKHKKIKQQLTSFDAVVNAALEKIRGETEDVIG